MKNTGKGETSTVEQGKVDEPTQITSRNDINRLEKMSEGDKLKIVSIETPLYKNIQGYYTPMLEEGSLTNEIKLKKGDIVTYKGNYDKIENPISGEVTVYLEVTTNDGTEGYLKLSTVTAIEEGKTTARANITKFTATVGNITNEGKKIGKDNEEYVVAIAAGRNSGNDIGIENKEKGLSEAELTIKVAEKVESLLKQYSNIKVVQTGSTATSGVEPEDRGERTRSANANLCIQIYFGDGDNAGVETIYKDGDDISQQLAEILAKNLSSSMGLTNLNAGTDSEKCKDNEGNSASLSIIENAAITGYPSVVAMGGNLNKEPDISVIENGGTDKYAQAIVNSIDEYFKADHSGRTAIENDNENTTYKDSTESKIINMRYVTQEKFQSYIDNGDVTNALKSYTIDDERNLVIASWSRKEDGNIELKTQNSMNLKTALQSYVMPYEYLLFFYLDTDYEEFTEELADEVIKSEIVMAVQDNVTTTNTIETTEQKTSATVSSFNRDWHETNKTNKTVESVSTSINVTYVQTWCVKAYQENSYSKAVLEMGENDEKIINVPGKVTENYSNSATSEEKIATGTGYYTVAENTDNGEGLKTVEKTYEYSIYQHILTYSHSISNSYEKGEYKTEGRENVFVDLYNKHNMAARVRTAGYLFEIIEENEKTANLLDLTKYLIYKATNVPWGVLQYDFDTFNLSKFTTMNSSGGLEQFKRWLHAWEGVNGSISADGTKYIIGDDGYGNVTVGYGVDIFNGGFAERFRDAGYSTSIGAEVDKEFVDSLEDEEINNALKTVESKCSGLNLTQYQKYALVSRIYNCGSGGAFLSRHGKDFVAAYSAYWNQDTDLEYKVVPNNSMYSNPLYTNYMCEPNTAAGAGFSQGLVNRRKAEWLLFKTGYYDRIDEYYAEGGSIAETAAVVHDYIYSNDYWYSLNRSGEPTLPGSVKDVRNVKGVCCATFVSWTLYEAGYDWIENCPNINSCGSLLPFLEKNGGTKILNPTMDTIQAGDIVFYSYDGDSSPDHTDIYIGDGLWYNCGGNDSVRRKDPYTKSLKYAYCVIRFN